MPVLEEPEIRIGTREQLLHTLAEAAEIEHNLMCCYLYAAWSLKTEPDDEVDPETRALCRRWQGLINSVAVEEMTHLALVANLMNAIGGVAHFSRPNFPIAPGSLPAGLVVRLAPFNPETLQHFIYLERPEGSDEPDAPSFRSEVAYERGQFGLRLMPSAQDYLTVGHLYRSVEMGLVRMVEELGEDKVFIGDPLLQVGPDIVTLAGLEPVTDLSSARAALETIVAQGEGAQINRDGSHYAKFVSIREDLSRLKPGQAPAFPAATNPVMRKPPVSENRVWVSQADARDVIDLGNAVYNQMLRCLSLGFASTDASEKRLMINAAIDLMMALVPLGQDLARMKANDEDQCNAGLSFATLRDLGAPRSHPNVTKGLALRSAELTEGAAALAQTPRVARAAEALRAVSATLFQAAGEAAPAVTPKSEHQAGAAPKEGLPVSGQATMEVVEGEKLTLVADMSRCIHSRFCVTGAPKTFLANVEGPWLHPDETDASRLVEIAHACPSGAIGYRGKDGRPDEAAPQVNMMRIREDGPNAIHAELYLAGKADGYRATFCRCGQSRNKPYCDGSHHDAGFKATGEPDTISLDPLSVRNGPLHVEPQRNGPLKVTGNLEICGGTGRVVQRVETAMLCRCGQSRRKPFCDGSHRAAGFVADGA